MHVRAIVMLTALAAFVVLPACGAGNKSGSVTVSAASSAAGSSGSNAAGGTALPAGLQITSVDVAVRELELEDGACAATSRPLSSDAGRADDDSDDECESEIGPFVAHLDAPALAAIASGEVPQVWSAPLRPGTYAELEVKLCAIDPSALSDADQRALAEAMQGFTVVVRGTYQAPGNEAGAADFTIGVPACAEIERDVRVTVDDTGAVSNLTLHVDLGAWFVDAQGDVIAPDSPAGVAAIAANIARTLNVYGDDDHDGHSDD